jgi:hypothetical protein
MSDNVINITTLYAEKVKRAILTLTEAAFHERLTSDDVYDWASALDLATSRSDYGVRVLVVDFTADDADDGAP